VLAHTERPGRVSHETAQASQDESAPPPTIASVLLPAYHRAEIQGKSPWDLETCLARKAAWQRFMATLEPLARASLTPLHDWHAGSLARRSLPRVEGALDATLAAWQEFRAVCEGGVR
jgi:hypothetical protein